MTPGRRLVLCAVLVLSLPSTGAAQRPAIELVDLAVEGPDGNALTGLTEQDFDIIVAGNSQPIESFAAGTAQPLSLVLLFDISASMQAMVKRSTIQQAVEKFFLGRVRPGDRVQVGTFGRQIAIGPPIAGNPRELLRAVEKALDPKEADTYGPSPLWDAIDAAVAALASATGRRAVIVVTDGRATGNREGPETVADRAVAAGVTVSALAEAWEMILRQDAKTGVRVRPGAALAWFATMTGGLYVADDGTQPAPGPLLERLLADLHGRYTLGFTPPMRDGKTHALEIRVKRPGLTLRARRTFIAPASSF
jgi:Ca-activated chloride channel family protein